MKLGWKGWTGLSLAALAWSFTAWNRPADASVYASVAHGLEKSYGILSPTVLWDYLLAIAWRMDGMSAVSKVRWFAVFLGAFCVLGLFAWGVRWVTAWKQLHSYGTILVVGVAVAVGAGGIVKGMRGRDALSVDPRLLEPAELTRALGNVQRIFANPTAISFLRCTHPGWLGIWTDNAAALSQDPSEWRKLHRKRRFEAVVLAGPPREYGALLQHLLNSPDWALVRLTPMGTAFLNAPAETSVRIVSPTAEALAWKDPASRTEALSRIAEVLAAGGMRMRAQDYIQAAVNMKLNRAPVFARAAVLAGQNQEWASALHWANTALDIDSRLLPALQVKVRALLALKKTNAALDLASHLFKLAPNDLDALFLAARAASVAHSYQQETEILGQILKVAERSGARTGQYRVYLGQSFAKQGLGKLALEQFQAALDSQDLSPHDQKITRDALRAFSN